MRQLCIGATSVWWCVVCVLRQVCVCVCVCVVGGGATGVGLFDLSFLLLALFGGLALLLFGCAWVKYLLGARGSESTLCVCRHVCNAQNALGYITALNFFSVSQELVTATAPACFSFVRRRARERLICRIFLASALSLSRISV